MPNNDLKDLPYALKYDTILLLLKNPPSLVTVSKLPFSTPFEAPLLLPGVVLVGNTSKMACIAPIRGSVTFLRSGRFFFSAYRWLTSRRFRRKPPSGNRTIQFRDLGINESRM